MKKFYTMPIDTAMNESWLSVQQFVIEHIVKHKTSRVYEEVLYSKN